MGPDSEKLPRETPTCQDCEVKQRKQRHASTFEWSSGVEIIRS